MSKRYADATPHAASLIQSLRDIGYSCETALADIIDNAITAEAQTIEIMSDAGAAHPALAIIDNGLGMSVDELVEAMRPGSHNPLSERASGDLGRFGLGLKSASFSQCKRLTVISRQEGALCGAVWDLDEVANTNRWEIQLLEEFADIPWIDRLGPRGTLVLWEKMDRLAGGIETDQRKRAEYINRAISGAERHIRLVFHRFMSEGKPPLAIRLNERKLEPLDPFGTKFASHQEDREDSLELGRGTVTFQCFTLPHHKSITKAEWDDLGGPEGHLRSQGFYVYRGGRLIIAGSWLGLARQTELTKLCRIKVDIPNTMDADWKIDVKKASAQLPPPVRERMRLLVEKLSSTSKRTYQRRGQRLVDESIMPLWQRIQKDGAVIYRPDPAHPVFADFSARLPDELQADFANLIGLVGSSMPVAALHADFAGIPEEVLVDDVDEPALRQLAEAMIPRLLDQGITDDLIPTILKQIDPFNTNWPISEPIISDIIAKEKMDG
ncbi:ATP-binding protein [Rhizorhabdus histidinilytica]|uniref:Histidine kinase-, DNA gyrase B-, and HSP90-like ATPase n=2 Tax=Rhizorhabdus histidinilytica TaxID=439228 RepID=A0A1T5FQ72_9SPHN|nr:Histidine kinase-, DNA gyrase B-, and HSP90-like ATPase [Rhizorhabdus histidinilytica]